MKKDSVILGDVHAPWTDLDCLEFAYNFIQRTQPKFIVQCGDAFDFYSFSKFPRNNNIIMPAEEVNQARKFLERMWKHIQKISPSSICYQMVGNHCMRPIKRIRELAPELEHMIVKGVRDLLQFDGVNTTFDPREELVLNGNIYIHGHRSKIGDHMRHYQSNVICGHTHRGGTHFERMFIKKGKQILWELNAGYMGNPDKHEALQYMPTKAYPWTLGLGYINNDNCPQFIPFNK